MIRASEKEFASYLFEIKMKGGKTYEEMLAARSPESQKRILEGAEKLQAEYLMTRIRKDLDMSQTELATALGVSQPVILKLEKWHQNIRVSHH